MVKMDYVVAIVRRDRVIESQFAYWAPIPERTPLKTHCSLSRALIGHLNLEGESAFRQRIASVKNLCHDFVAKIQGLTVYPGLFGRDEQTHELRGSRGDVFLLAELGDLVQLSDRGFLIRAEEDCACNEQDRQPAPATPGAGVGGVACLRIVDVVGMISADVLLGDKVGGPKRFVMVWVCRRKQLADQRQRSRVAAPSLSATSGIALLSRALDCPS